VSNAQEFQAWLQRGGPLVQNHKQAKWALGEWLLEVDASQAASVHNGNWWPYQPNHHPYCSWIKDAAQHYGYAYDTFLQFKRVAAAFPPATRVAPLSWHHHQAVAAIEDPKVRAEWLSLAKFYGWSSKELQQKVAIAKAGLSMAEAVQMSQLAGVLGMAASEIQVLIVREFLCKDDETISNFVFKHRASFAGSD
jgi:hypothetical protein